MTQSIAPSCPSCGATPPRKIGSLPRSPVFAGVRVKRALPASALFECPGCGLVFRYPVLSVGAYDVLYGKVDAAC